MKMRCEKPCNFQPYQLPPIEMGSPLAMTIMEESRIKTKSKKLLLKNEQTKYKPKIFR